MTGNFSLKQSNSEKERVMIHTPKKEGGGVKICRRKEGRRDREADKGRQSKKQRQRKGRHPWALSMILAFKLNCWDWSEGGKKTRQQGSYLEGQTTILTEMVNNWGLLFGSVTWRTNTNTKTLQLLAVITMSLIRIYRLFFITTDYVSSGHVVPTR